MKTMLLLILLLNAVGCYNPPNKLPEASVSKDCPPCPKLYTDPRQPLREHHPDGQKEHKEAK